MDGLLAGWSMERGECTLPLALGAQFRRQAVLAREARNRGKLSEESKRRGVTRIQLEQLLANSPAASLISDLENHLPRRGRACTQRQKKSVTDRSTSGATCARYREPAM